MPKFASLHHSGSYSDSRYFYTSSLYLAAYLYAHGLWLSNAERDSRGTYRFAFQDAAERERLVQQFQYSPKALVDARTFVYALEEVQRRAVRVRCVNYDA